MADQDPPQDPNDPSFLDPDGPADEDDDDAEPSDPEESESEPDSPLQSTAMPSAPEPAEEEKEEEDEPAPKDEPESGDLHFDDDDLGEKLQNATDDQLDQASFGIIQVDDEGAVEFFNQYESDLSGMDPEEVKGRNFFTQVAPCTNNRLFRGRFKKGVRSDELDETFTYTYTYKMRPTLVDVHLYRDDAGNNWITVQKY